MNILIPLAAFAVSLTGASVLSPDLMRQAGLNEDQIAAFEEARELKESGDYKAARDVLVSAKIDEDVMEHLREAMKGYRHDHNIAIKAAIEANDYESFRAAVKDSPMGEIIDTKAEFERFVQAHALIESGDKDEAKEIFDELGLNWGHGHLRGGSGDGHEHPFMDKLSENARESLKEAMRNRDHDRVQEILKEAGVEMKAKWGGWKNR